MTYKLGIYRLKVVLILIQSSIIVVKSV